MKSMDSNPNVKKLKNDDLDMISKLPDSILSIILFKLPLKNALATCVLSTRWKNVFPFGLPPIRLYLDDSERSSRKGNEPEPVRGLGSSSFVNFMDRLFNKTFSDNTCVDSIVLNCEKDYGDKKVISWLRAALRLSVRDIRLGASLHHSKNVLRCLNGCTTLSSLELTKSFELCVPNKFRLPNLKRLSLNHGTFRDGNGGSINELIAGCLVLEHLSLYRCNLQFLGFLHIRAPFLKYLSIWECWNDSTCHLLLDVPNLEELSYEDVTASAYALSQFKSLDCVQIDVGSSAEPIEDFDEAGDDGLARLLTICSSTNTLYLSYSSAAAIHNSTVPLPEFENLTCLSVGQLELAFLARLLWHAPKLKELKIEEGFYETETETDTEEYAGFESLVQRSPFCLEWNLKKIHFGVYEGDEDEIKLMDYFLINGKVLEELIIYCIPSEKSMLRKLLPLPEHSKILLGPRLGDKSDSIVSLSDVL